jgi:formylglycine-generating enzyme required for sulfatase activity
MAGAAWWTWTGRAGPSAALRTGAAATPQAPTHCPLPPDQAGAPAAGLVWVPAGRLRLGDGVYPEEGRSQEVAVDGFWMDRTEVTNDQFAAFVAATGYVTVPERRLDPARHPGLPAALLEPGAVVFSLPQQPSADWQPSQAWRFVAGAQWRHPGGPGTDIAGKGAFPVVAVTYADAQAYARWVGRQLPTEAQWEWAARQAQAPAEGAAVALQAPPQANTWQGRFPVHNSGDDGFVGLAPVACYPANALGLHDLLGNVWEYTADAYAPRADGQEIRPWPAGRRVTARVIKGGSFLCAPNHCMRYRPGSRQPQEEDLAASHLGFRTVMPATKSATGGRS